MLSVVVDDDVAVDVMGLGDVRSISDEDVEVRWWSSPLTLSRSWKR